MSGNRILPLACLLLGSFLSYLVFDQKPQSAQAMTAHGTENKTMLTVPIDVGMEAVVTLDHVTGDMTGYVLDRINGQFFLQYRYNVHIDFPQTRGKYLMAAGLADFRNFNTNNRIANGVVYVSEENSGQVVAYGIPWNTQMRASNALPQKLVFVPLDRAQTRFTELR
jgi:hypothetical protein